MSISPQGILLIIIAASLMSVGSLGLRGAIDSIGGFGNNVGTVYKDIFALLLNPIFIFGLLTYGSGTLLWMRVMATEPLSTSYPILMSIAFITVTLGAALLFKEALSPMKLVGMAIIVVGVIITTNS